MAMLSKDIERFNRLGQEIQEEIRAILKIIGEHISQVARSREEAAAMMQKAEEEFHLLLDIFEDDEDPVEVQAVASVE